MKQRHYIFLSILMLIMVILSCSYFYLKKQGYRVSIYQKEDRFFSGDYYENTTGKPELGICSLTNASGHNIYQEFSIFKEIFEEMGYFVHPVENTEQCDVAINAGFPKKKVKNKDAFKIYLEMEPREPIFEGYDLSIGYIHSSREDYFRLPLSPILPILWK